MKILVPALAAVMLIGAVATATPAQAQCWWNGYRTVCAPRYHHYYHPWRYHHRYYNHHWGYYR